MAESTKQSQETNKSISYEETHFLRIANLLITIAPSAVRVKFDKEFHPDVLQKILYQERFKMNNFIFNLDLTLMISLIRHLTPIPVGDILPLTTDISEGADLSRLKYYRNKISHSDTGTLSETDFHQWWTDISEAIQRLSRDRFKQTCNDLKYAKLDQNDKEIPIEIRNIARTNDSITKGVQKLHEMQIQEWESEKIVETRAIKELIHLMTYNNIVLELTKLSGIKIFLEDISDQLHLQSSFSIQVLKSEIHNLKKTYVQKHGETYRIGNEKVFDILVAFCGEKKFDLILDIADADIIRDRFLLRVMTKTIENVSLQDVIHVDEKNERKYFDRLLKDIENGFIEKVFSNRNLNSSLVRKQFVEYIKGKVDFNKVLTHLPQQKLYSLLLSMLHHGHSELVPMLLTKDINYNLTNWNGDTPLYTASYKGYTNIVKLLLENNANPNISTWICEKPQNNVKLKYQHDFDDNSKRHHSDRGEVESPNWAALRKRKCSLDGLFDGSVFQIPHHVIRRYQVTSLYIASKEGYFDIVRLLLEYKADPNVICDSDKVSPLIVSSRKGYTSIVKWLLLYRGDHNRTSCDASKTTPLYEASSEGHTDIVKLLLNHNADHNRRCTWKEDTAMDRAVCNNRIGVVEELLKHKIDCTISNRETKIPLFVAVENNYKKS
ncbi:unnamed protein product [Mytilus edulis]|uniref:DZIP3-like HEPN domain-containing protein n=1 Tax=Mytilus edulis TaxID=6550 RepID=A0A8S3RKW5_MYTED|nr:unnamed protein product [Mytilus edulis]